MDRLNSESLALEALNEMQNDVDNLQTSATWEHEELAQVKVRVLRGHKKTVKSCQFCVGGTKILTASHDESILLWDVESGRAVKRFRGHCGLISQAKASSDGKRLISTGWDKKVIMWDTESGQILWTGTHGGIVTCGNWSHNDKFVITGSDLDAAIHVRDSGSGEIVQTVTGSHKSTITSAYFSKNDDKIFTTSMDYTAKVWDLRSNVNTITMEGHRNIVSDSCCSSNERRLATVSWDKSIRLWDIATGEYRSKGGSLLKKAHEGSISSCDFSQDGTLLVTGGYDNQVLVWDVDNLVLKLRLPGHLGWVEDVCFSPNQKWILSCGKDTTVRLWKIDKAEHITMVKHSNKIYGQKLQNCSDCGKLFSCAKAETQDEARVCVFCRLQSMNRNSNQSTEDTTISTIIDDI